MYEVVDQKPWTKCSLQFSVMFFMTTKTFSAINRSCRASIHRPPQACPICTGASHGMPASKRHIAICVLQHGANSSRELAMKLAD